MSKILDNSRLQSQEDASYTLVSPTLPYLKGVAKLKGLQDEVSCILVFHVEELDILMFGVFSSLSYYQSYLVIC